MSTVSQLSPLQQGWKNTMMNAYGTPALGLVRGEGCVVEDENGKEYLDLLSGIAVNSLGHQHPAIIEAVTQQLHTLGHTSNFFVHQPEVQLAERLVEAFKSDQPTRVFFCNSGAEANEIAFKLSRLTGRRRILTHLDGFHGRTMGSLALTGQEKKRAPFEPMPPGVEYFPFNDFDALQQLVEKDPHNTAAVMIEPIMGEAGVMVPDADYLAKIRELTQRYGILMICDEVQTGVGRTGDMFCSRAQGVIPDVVTLAKGLAGGFPIGTVLATGRAADFFQPGSHGTTFGGNPYSCAAANAVLDTIESAHLYEHVRAMGERFRGGLADIHHSLIREIRGRGLLIGIELTEAVGPYVEQTAREAGFIINAARPQVLRIAPPLVISAEQIDAAVAALPGILESAQTLYTARCQACK